MEEDLVYDALSRAKVSVLQHGDDKNDRRTLMCKLRELCVHESASCTWIHGPFQSGICSALLRVVEDSRDLDDFVVNDTSSIAILKDSTTDSMVMTILQRGDFQIYQTLVVILTDMHLTHVEKIHVEVERCEFDATNASVLDICMLNESEWKRNPTNNDLAAAELVYKGSSSVIWLSAKIDEKKVGIGAIYGAGESIAIATVALLSSVTTNEVIENAITDAICRHIINIVSKTTSRFVGFACNAQDARRFCLADGRQRSFVFRMYTKGKKNTTPKPSMQHPGLRCTFDSPFDIDDIYAGHKIWEQESLMKGTHAGNGKVVDADDGRVLWDFGTCSYMGIEKHPFIVSRAQRAYEKYGLSTVSSRSYLENPEIPIVEDIVSAKLGGYFLIAPKTHIATNVWATTSVHPEDAVVLDKEVHVSIQYATDISAHRGTAKVLVPHGDVEATIWAIKVLAKSKRRVWFCADGLHSMRGEMFPPAFARLILDAAPNAYLFIDDSHGIGWTGEHGCGAWISSFPTTERVVVAVSLCKAVAAGGGGLLFGSREERDYAKVAGVPLHWTAPLNAPILAGITAFFEWIDTMEGLAKRASFEHVLREFNRIMKTEHPDIPLANYEPLPIKAIHAGTLDNAVRAVRGLRDDGFYACVCSYPVAPKGHAAVRFTFSASIPDDVVCHDLVASIVKHCSGFPKSSMRMFDSAFSSSSHRRDSVPPAATCSRRSSDVVPVPMRCLQPHRVVLDNRTEITIEPLVRSDDVDMLSSWFHYDDPLSECLGIEQKEWIDLGRAWIGRCVNNNISFVARMGNELVGGLILERFETTIPPSSSPSTKKPIDIVLGLVAELESALKEKEEVNTRQFYRIVFASTSPNMRNTGILSALARHVYQMGSSECIDNKISIIASTSSEYSRRAALANGMTELHTIRYDRWLFDGRHPLAAAKSPHEVASLLYMEFPMPWGPWLRCVYNVCARSIKNAMLRYR